MQRITQDSEVEEVLSRIGVGEEEKLRESEKRREYLEKFAQLRSREPDTSLDLQNVRTAFVQIDEELEEFREIVVSSNKVDKQEYNFPERYHDFLVQKGYTVHEVAHILYSDYPSLKKYTEKVKEDEMDKEGQGEEEAETYASMFHGLFNALEDGAIEKFASERYRVGEELYYMRHCIHEDSYMGRSHTDGSEEIHTYPFFFAVMTAIMNIGVYDNGELRKLLDPEYEDFTFGKRGREKERKMFIDSCLPEIRDTIIELQSEEDAEERVRLAYELWNFLKDYMNRSITEGKHEWKQRQKRQEENSYLPGVPEDIGEGHGEQNAVPIIEPGDEDEEGGGGGGDEEAFGEERRDQYGGEKLEEKAEDGILSESKQQGEGDWSDEIEEIIDALGAGSGTDEISIAEEERVDLNRKQKAEKYGRRAEKLFRRKLRMLKKDVERRGKRRGRVDTRSMMKAERGETRIFKKKEEGEEKDYSCIIVADRSGSMSNRIEEVEYAIGALAYGLEGNGVDVSVLDTHKSETTLSKPFGGYINAFENRIFTGKSGGGTPIRHTVEFARNRVNQGAGEAPFVIIITDGRPRDQEGYKEQIKKMNCPVLGVYLTDNREYVDDQLELFDIGVVSTPDDDIQKQLIGLIKRIVF